MTFSRIFTLITIISHLTTNAGAQNSSGTMKLSELTLVLPNGTILPGEKFDSLEKAWGKGRISFRHSTTNDKKGIMHLIQVTDEMLQRSEATRTEALNKIINKPAPDFELIDLAGNKWSLASLKGKTVVLNFWSTSCGPCIQEMPELNKLVNSYPAGEVVFLALNPEDIAQTKSFLKKHSFQYTLLPNAKLMNEQFNIDSWPTSIVIDQKGIVKMIMGSSSTIREELEAAIEKVKSADVPF